MSVAENRDEGRRSNVIAGGFQGRHDKETLSPEQVRTRLLMPPGRPSWGPDAGERIRASTWSRFWRITRNGLDRDEHATNEERQIAVNYENHRKIFEYRNLYIGWATASLLVVLAALATDYWLISELWTRALQDEFGDVPASMETSILFKSLQVVFATLAVHLFISKLGEIGRIVFSSIAFFLVCFFALSLGFIYANTNLSGLARVNAVEEERANLGDALAQLGLSPETRGASLEPQTSPEGLRLIPLRDGMTRCPSGYERYNPNPNLCREKTVSGDAPSAFDFEKILPFSSLPESWRKNASLSIALLSFSLIFLIITIVAALFIEAAQQNINNYMKAMDFRARKSAYERWPGNATS